jgi:hypothetical protein
MRCSQGGSARRRAQHARLFAVEREMLITIKSHHVSLEASALTSILCS